MAKTQSPETLRDLKAEAFDVFVKIQDLQKHLLEINKKITEFDKEKGADLSGLFPDGTQDGTKTL